MITEPIDHEAANLQVQRAEELREMVQLGHEENFNMFEMVPRTPHDNYFSKLTAGSLKTAIASTSEDNVERDVQTEELTMESKFNQAPEDFMKSYDTGKYQKKKRRENEALLLEKFVSRAGPLMETILEENERLKFIKNKGNASDKPAVEVKTNLKFP